MAKQVRVEVWSDVVCPWCYIGKRRLERALAGFDHADDVEVVWRSFQLDPSVPRGTRVPVLDHLRARTGGDDDQVREMNAHVTRIAAADGLAYRLDGTTMVNTLDAHRLAHLAAAHGRGAQAHEALLHAQLVENEVLDDPDTLVRLAAAIGLPAEAARAALAGDAYRADVEADLREARRIGVTGVPFFLFNRAYAVSGAQPADLLRTALRRTYDEQPAARV